MKTMVHMHGSYAYELSYVQRVISVSVEVAYAFFLPVRQPDEVETFEEFKAFFPNKGYRVVFEEDYAFYALYKHDGVFHLMAIDVTPDSLDRLNNRVLKLPWVNRNVERRKEWGL